MLSDGFTVKSVDQFALVECIMRHRGKSDAYGQSLECGLTLRETEAISPHGEGHKERVSIGHTSSPDGRGVLSFLRNSLSESWFLRIHPIEKQFIAELRELNCTVMYWPQERLCSVFFAKFASEDLNRDTFVRNPHRA